MRNWHLPGGDHSELRAAVWMSSLRRHLPRRSRHLMSKTTGLGSCIDFNRAALGGGGPLGDDYPKTAGIHQVSGPFSRLRARC